LKSPIPWTPNLIHWLTPNPHSIFRLFRH